MGGIWWAIFFFFFGDTTGFWAYIGGGLFNVGRVHYHLGLYLIQTKSLEYLFHESEVRQWLHRWPNREKGWKAQS